MTQPAHEPDLASSQLDGGTVLLRRWRATASSCEVSADDRVWREVVDAVGTAAADCQLVAAIVFGSLARGEHSRSSDVDVFVVLQPGIDPGAIRRRIRAAAAGTSIEATITPIFFTASALVAEARSRPSFAAHLRDEGVVVFETPAFAAVESGLGRASDLDHDAIETELAERTGVLDQLTDIERFNGEFVPALSQLYALSRSVVIVKLLQHGVPEYSWKRMFDVFADVRPDLRSDLRRLRALRPYYEHMHGRSELSDADQQVDPSYLEAAIDSVRAVADSNPGAGS
jgi:hypothetical protein